MKFLVLIFFYILSTNVKAQNPFYFGSGEAVNLTNGIKYNNTIKNIAGSLDPTVTVVNATAGSLYESTNGKLYVKQDAGASTNWFPLASTSQLPTINGQSGPAITLSSGTSGTDFALATTLNTVTFNLPTSSATNRGALSSADWTTFNSKAGRVAGSFSQYVYVNYLSGSDVACPAVPCGDGSLDRPFKTINFAMTTITDATQNKPYVIGLNGARQIETSDILVKPYVSIVGMGQRASYIRAPGFNIKPDATHSSGSSWVLLKNFYLGGGTGINWDLQAIGGSNCVLILENLTVGGILTYKGRNAGGGDFLEAYTNIIFGTITLDSVYSQLQTGEYIGAINFTNTQAVGGVSSSLFNLTSDGGISSTDHNLNMFNVSYSGTAGITTTGTLTLDSFRGLPNKSLRTLSGGTTVTNRDNATIVPYAPATPANWGVVPTDVSGALDYLASTIAAGSISSLNGLTAGVQTFAFGSTGTAPNVSSVTSTHTFNFPLASGVGVTSGTISKTDYDTFNGKVSSSSGSSTDNHIATWDSTTGKVIQDNSTAVLSDTGSLTGLTFLTAGSVNLSTNRVTTTGANQDLSLDPNGTGKIQLPGLTASLPLQLDASKLITSALINLTSAVTGILPMANGGTSKNLTAANGGIVYTDTDSMEVLAAGTSGQYLISNGAAAPSWTTAVPGSIQYATILDVKTDGTDGGTFTSGAWQTRTLNTLTDNGSIGVSLSSNQFTLPAGNYMVEFKAIGFAVDQHQTRLRNITDSTTSGLGLKFNSSSGGSGCGESAGVAFLTLASSKTFELQHRSGTTKTTNGFGSGTSTFGENVVFAQVIIRKI